MCRRVGHADGDDWCFDAELFVEPRRRDYGFHHGLSDGDNGLYVHSDGWGYWLLEFRIRCCHG